MEQAELIDRIVSQMWGRRLKMMVTVWRWEEDNHHCNTPPIWTLGGHLASVTVCTKSI